MSQLNPIHSSLLKQRIQRIRPHGMSYMVVTAEQRETLERISLDIFTDMSNTGASFQESLAAIYLSGLKHAIELQ